MLRAREELRFEWTEKSCGGDGTCGTCALCIAPLIQASDTAVHDQPDGIIGHPLGRLSKYEN